MADVNKDSFSERLKSIQRKTSPDRRVERRVTKDGLVVDVVKPRRRSLLPVKSILMAALLFVGVKGFIFSQLGETEYMTRLESLKQGNAYQVSAAFLLDADPATLKVAELLNKTLN